MDRKSIMGSPPLYSCKCLRIYIMTMIIHVYLEWPYDISTSGAIVEIVVQCGWYLANATGVIVHFLSILSPSPFARYSRSIFCRSGALYARTSRPRAVVLSVQRSINLFRWLRIFSAGACVRDLHACCDEYVEERASQPQATVVGQARACYYSR